MGKPSCLWQELYTSREHTQGSKTFQYLEEQKPILPHYTLFRAE